MNQNPRLLIVDDSIAICNYLKALLEDFGVTNTAMRHEGLSALQLVEQNPVEFDAIVVDLHMEGMDGLELISQLNKIHYRGGIIMMSALDKKILDFAFEIVSNFNLRILGSIEKPINKTVLAFLLKRIQNNKPTVFEKTGYIKRRDLFDAIKHKKVLTWFQPKIARTDNSLMGLECLVRLDLGSEGVYSPDRFIPVAENFGLIEVLMEAILDTALPQYKEFIQNTNAKPSLSINISPLQLHNDMLPEILAEYFNKHEISRDNILLEVTENYVIREKMQLKNLNRLRIHGFQLSLDDYGAGYTNLRQLKNMPFNEIKLDSALVDGISSDKVLQIIVKSVADICSQRDITLIAEGVVDPKDLLTLEHLGVDGFQGYIFCRPKPLNELLRWYKVWSSTIISTTNEMRISNNIIKSRAGNNSSK